MTTKAVLFDLDGVLIETERETFSFYKKYLNERHNINLKDSDFRYKAGRKSKNFFNDVLTPEQRELVNTDKLIELKRKFFNTQISKYAKRVDGGKELLELLKENHYLLALCSQNEPRMIESALKWLGIKKYFQIILSLADIKNQKPNPEIYISAAEKLKVKPLECAVIEDSQDGILAAKRGGFKCIGIRHSYMPKQGYRKADKVVAELKAISLSLIKSLEQKKRGR